MKNPLVIVPFILLCVVVSAQDAHHPIISAIYANDKPLNLSGDSIVVKSSDQLSFVFSGERQEGTLYFLLENEDTKPRNDPAALYAKLKAGTYQFRTFVEKQNETVSAPPITVVVRGSFMTRWWFVPLLIFYLLLLFGGAIYFIMLSNFRNREKLAELRNDWTNKLHNDIGGDLSSVSLRLQMLKRKIEPLDPKVKEGVVKTYQILESIQKKLRFVFDLVDPKKDSLQIMLADVKDYAEENFALKNMQFQYEDDVSAEYKQKLDIGRVNKLYLALKEVINNSVKYSEGTLAVMHLSKTKAGLQIELKDNGKGFDTQKPANGNGLNNLQQYSMEGFLDIKIDSEVGKGTTAMIVVPDI